jgi:hypothetical protein
MVYRKRGLPGIGVGLACAVLAGAGCGISNSAASEATSLEDLAVEVQEHVATVWPRTGQLWPGVDFSDHVLLLSDGKATWAIDKDGHRPISMADLADKDVTIPKAGFDMLSWEGRNAVIIPAPSVEQNRQRRRDPTGLSSADPAMYVFELATHEQFHTYFQLEDSKQPWASLEKMEEQDDGGGRFDQYPLQAKPRLYRAMVYNSLLAAYQNPGKRDEHLSAAAYWQDTWARNYPDEAKSQAPTELLEGTAKYFEKAAVAMAAAEDPQNAYERHDYLAHTLKPMAVPFKAFEPYAIGVGALLNADQGELVDLQNRLADQPVTPLSQVLQGVKPTKQATPEDIEKSITDATAEKNETLSRQIDPFVTGMLDSKSWVLMMPADTLRGTLNASGLYTTKALPIPIFPNAALSFKLKTGQLELDDVTTGQDDRGEDSYFIVPLDPNGQGTTLSGNTLRLDTGHVTGTFTVSLRTERGQRYLYAH